MADKKLNVVFKGIDELTPMLKKGELSADQFKRKLSELNSNKIPYASNAPNANPNGGFFKSLKSQVGEESNFGNTMKMLKGAGAIAGVTLMANELVKVTDAMVGLKNGTKQWGDVLASIPIFGQGYQIGKNIRELVTGEAAAKEEAKKWADYAQLGYESVKKTVVAIKQQREEQQKLNAESNSDVIRLFAGDKAADKYTKKLKLDDEVAGYKTKAQTEVDKLEPDKKRLKEREDAVNAMPVKTTDEFRAQQKAYQDYTSDKLRYDSQVVSINNQRDDNIKQANQRYQKSQAVDGSKEVVGNLKKVGEGVNNFFGNLWGGVKKKAESDGDHIKKLKEEADTEGMSWKERKLYELKQSGVSGAALKRGTDYIDEIDKKKQAAAPGTSKTLATLQEGGTLTGVAQISMERDNIATRTIKLAESSAKHQEKTAQNTERVANGIERLLTALSPTTQAVGSIFGL